MFQREATTLTMLTMHRTTTATAVVSRTFALLLLCGATQAQQEALNAVPYPNPQFWEHAWPYSTVNAVTVDADVSIVLDVASTPVAVASADPSAQDPLVAEILTR